MLRRIFYVLATLLLLLGSYVFVHDTFFIRQVQDTRINREYFREHFPKGADFSAAESELLEFGYKKQECHVSESQKIVPHERDACFNKTLFEGYVFDSIKVTQHEGKIVKVSDGGSYDKRKSGVIK